MATKLRIDYARARIARLGMMLRTLEDTTLAYNDGDRERRVRRAAIASHKQAIDDLETQAEGYRSDLHKLLKTK